MQAVLSSIFSFSGGYNYLHRQVCSEFRSLIGEREDAYLYYLDDLCRDRPQEVTKYIGTFSSSAKIAKLALDKGLFYLLTRFREHVPSDVANIAALKGNLDILRWSKEQGYDPEDYCFSQAVLGGHLHILQWLDGDDNDYYTYDDLFALAAEVGNVEILQWLDDNNYKRDEKDCVCNYAAEKGHIHVIEWCLKKGWMWDKSTCLYAAEGGQLETLKWLEEKGYFRQYPGRWNVDLCSGAATHGQLEVLQWLREKGGFIALR